MKTLDKFEKDKLLQLLHKFDHLFDGTLGNWKTEPVDLELKEDAKPAFQKYYPVPKSQERKLREEVDRLVNFGVMRKVNKSEWGSPVFVINKPDGSLRSLADLRKVNSLIKRCPYPIPKIQDMLLKLEGFQWATSLDLNMGYYHIELTPNASRICTVVLPWGKYEYLRLPMGLCNSPDIFQEKMSELMEGLEFAKAYLDDLLIITNESRFDVHLEHLAKVLTRLAEAGLKVCADKSSFCQHELKYLGYWITRDGIKPLTKKVEAILNMDEPKTRKELRRFLGMVNFYRDMWPNRSETLAPLTALTSSSNKFKWEEKHSKAFAKMKRIMARETLLAYPDFSKPFDIHTDASNTQLGACISQEGKPIAFYSRKLNPAQTRYTTTEQELLSIVETLKEFRTILLGQELNIHTDHKNLIHNCFTTDRVLRWRLYLEEYTPKLHYIEGPKNKAADALSRLPFTERSIPAEELMTLENYSEWFCYEQDDRNYHVHPLSYKMIEKAQKNDPDLKKKCKDKTSKYYLAPFHGGGNTRHLVCYDGKIVVPKILRNHILNWYHTTLLYPGMNRTHETIAQHSYWPKLKDDCENLVKHCPTCQRNKRKAKSYGLLPPQNAEAIPWDHLCIDLIGPYTITRKGQEDLICKCVTMIDPATGWFEIAQYDDKRSITIANIAETEWFARYPWPNKITFDRGSEFIGKDFQDMVTEDYGLEKAPITVRNPQANAIVEQIHQTLANLVRTFELENNYLDEEDPWKGILAAAAFAVRSTYHTTLQKTPGQLVYGRDMILNVKHLANWEYIRQRKQHLINKNNNRENEKRIPHVYKRGDKVLLRRGTENKYETPYSGPHTIEEVSNNNGTVRMKVGHVTDTYNIRRIHPYY